MTRLCSSAGRVAVLVMPAAGSNDTAIALAMFAPAMRSVTVSPRFTAFGVMEVMVGPVCGMVRVTLTVFAPAVFAHESMVIVPR